MPREHFEHEQGKRRTRRDGSALLESLEARTLLSTGPHYTVWARDVRADSMPEASAFVVRAADQVVSANATGVTFGPPESVVVVGGGTMESNASAGNFISGKPANLSPTDTKSATVEWTKVGEASSAGPWTHPDGSGMNVTLTQGSSSSADAVYATATNAGGKSFGMLVYTATERPAFRRADEAPSTPTPPPDPPTVVVAAAANSSPAISANQTQSTAIAPHAAVTLRQAEQSASGRTAQPAGAANVVSTVVSAATPAIAASVEKYTFHNPPDLSWSAGILGINTELTAFTEILQRPGVFASAGQSVDFMEKLLISDAAALAQVANGVAMRLNEENALLWKGAGGLLGVAMIVAAGASRERPASRLPRRQRRNPRHLCVGERSEVATEL